MSTFNRRQVMAGIGATSLLPVVGQASEHQSALSLSTPQENLDAYVKLVGSIGAEMLFTHYD